MTDAQEYGPAEVEAIDPLRLGDRELAPGDPVVIAAEEPLILSPGKEPPDTLTAGDVATYLGRDAEGAPVLGVHRNGTDYRVVIDSADLIGGLAVPEPADVTVGDRFPPDVIVGD